MNDALRDSLAAVAFRGPPEYDGGMRHIAYILVGLAIVAAIWFLFMHGTASGF